jgi:hypothetical protein
MNTQSFVRRHHGVPVLRAMVLLALGFMLGRTAFAQEVVSSTADSGTGSLRAAIATANPGDRITFAPALSGRSIVLASNELVIAKNLTLDASSLPNGVVLTVNRSVDKPSRIFEFLSGTTNTLLGLSLSMGGRYGIADAGGAIYLDSGATLTISDCTLYGNSTMQSGGAIYNDHGSLTLNNSSMVLNSTSDGDGGGIYNNGGSITISNCAFTQNYADLGRACIYNNNGVVAVQASAFDGNDGHGVSAIYNTGTFGISGSSFATNGPAAGVIGVIYNSGTATATNSAFFGNNSYGSVIYNDGGFSIIQCTFSNNSRFYSGAAIFNRNNAAADQCTFCFNQSDPSTPAGGAIDNQGSLTVNNSALYGNQGVQGGAINNVGTVYATNCTIVANFAQAGNGVYNEGVYGMANCTLYGNLFQDPTNGIPSQTGGGVWNSGDFFSVNSIIAGNGASAGPDFYGVLTSQGHNLIQDTNACSISGDGTGNFIGVDPIVGPFDDYGGSTLTIPLLAGSPAIDGGDTANGPAFDERGHARPFGAASDIGAFESSPPYTIRGVITGSTLKDVVLLHMGTNAVPLANGVPFRFDGLNTGSYLIDPQNTNYLFVPASYSLTVGPDRLGVDFKAYHWNEVSVDELTNSVVHLVFPGSDGQGCFLQASGDLHQWQTISTNTVGPGRYAEWFYPVDPLVSPTLFYRIALP